jgi:lipoprotein-anchoring transpeptidase ErfK/SrfK
MVLALGFALEPCSQASFWGAQPTGPKRVVVDKSQQELRAYEGNQLVFQSRISSGKRGRETPSGHFRVQSKSLMHRSRLYNNAPMPYSVQFAGNYFIHGFKSVPHHPASHGCIRLPIGQAQQFYQWADRGTPVQVVQ